jgi:serine/threonine protein kinase
MVDGGVLHIGVDLRRTSASGGGSETADEFGLVGTLIDRRYLVEEVVGSGGFGVVYRARHLRLDSNIAIKVARIPREQSSLNRQHFVDSFVNEGKLLFSLGALHPAIVRVLEAGTLEYGTADVAPYLAMEWLDGTPLSGMIAQWRMARARTLELGEAMGLLDDVAAALETVHAAGIAHRDIKPGNIYLCRIGNRYVPKVVDFGLAKALNQQCTLGNQVATARGAYSFTAAYAAPEQWEPRLGQTGPWTDVHALALVCFELLCGRRPFVGTCNAELSAACLNELVRPTPRSAGLQLPAAVESVFARAVAINPRERYPDAGAFWRALREASAELLETSRSGGMVELVSSAAIALVRGRGGAASPERQKQAAVNSTSPSRLAEQVTAAKGAPLVRKPSHRTLGYSVPVLLLVAFGVAWSRLPSGMSAQIPARSFATTSHAATKAVESPVLLRSPTSRTFDVIADLPVGSAASASPKTVTHPSGRRLTTSPSGRAPAPAVTRGASEADTRETLRETSDLLHDDALLTRL